MQEISIGKYAELEVVKVLGFGAYLNGGVLGEILLPIRYMPEGTRVGDMLTVFLYLDSEERLIATTLKPFATVGEVALLKVKSKERQGFFLEWGLPTKDLFLPFGEAYSNIEIGRRVVVYLYLDKTSSRITATTRLETYISSEYNFPYSVGDKVNGMVVRRSDLGYKVLIDNTYWGLIYTSEVFREMRIGEKLDFYIKLIRDNKKIDLVLQPQGYKAAVSSNTEIILEKLKNAPEGFLMLDDDSTPDEIYFTLNMSKKNFKKAIGALYKERKIVFLNHGIKLSNS